MVNAKDILIPLKFFLIMAQFILTIVVDYTKLNNINSQIDYYSASQVLNQLSLTQQMNHLILALYILQCIELLLMFISYTMFMHKLTSLSIIFHGIANLCLCWFIWQFWIMDKFWIILTIGGIIPVAIEIITYLYIMKFRKINLDYKYFY